MLNLVLMLSLVQVEEKAAAPAETAEEKPAEQAAAAEPVQA